MNFPIGSQPPRIGTGMIGGIQGSVTKKTGQKSAAPEPSRLSNPTDVYIGPRVTASRSQLQITSAPGLFILRGFQGPGGKGVPAYCTFDPKTNTARFISPTALPRFFSVINQNQSPAPGSVARAQTNSTFRPGVSTPPTRATTPRQATSSAKTPSTAQTGVVHETNNAAKAKTVINETQNKFAQLQRDFNKLSGSEKKAGAKDFIKKSGELQRQISQFKDNPSTKEDYNRVNKGINDSVSLLTQKLAKSDNNRIANAKKQTTAGNASFIWSMMSAIP